MRFAGVAPVRLVMLAAWAWLTASSAQAATAAVVVPTRPHPDVTATLSRLHGELLSIGLDVDLVAGPVGVGTREPAGDAVIAIVGEKAPLAVDVWVRAKPPRASRYARVTVEPGTEDAAGRLAIRAIEVLRSSFLEGELTARAERRPVAPATAQPDGLHGEAVRGSPSRERLGLELGAALLTSVDGTGPAVLPILRADWAVQPWLVLQATVAGPGTTPSVATAAGAAEVDQHHGVVGACLRWRSTQSVRPFVGLAAGALRTAVRGRTLAPRQAHTEVRWSFLAEGSAGLAFHLGERYSVTLAAHAQVAEPFVAVHFGDAVVATSARPNLLLTLTAGAWL